jgi:histone-lysine N-methyltransferase SETD3
MGQETEIGRQVLNADLDLDAPKHVYLMLYMLQDRLNPNSFFKPYYDILPQTFSNMPIFWREDELQHLQGSYILTQIAERIEAIEDDYRAICDVCPQLRAIATLEDFKWARMCVCSRNFGLQIDGNRTSAMVPHADMLNHYRPRETKWAFDDEKQAFTITS